ncbi:sulfurtransferase complex subunit TusC [Methylomarinum sp. Ch1-1]|uniref:Sulfurtransferase complex subunit TusC n=1 Tax=Methylomarinum roseum TaxID=3067653 RepID=A0AAU7NRC0_9GAMM
MIKNFLFVMSQAPHDGAGVQETLDIILTTAAFDQSVSLLFLDDGVLQLHQRQQSEKVGLKDTAAIFQALQIYDVHEYFVESESLQHRGLKPGNLILPVQEVYRKDINALMRRFDRVISA